NQKTKDKYQINIKIRITHPFWFPSFLTDAPSEKRFETVSRSPQEPVSYFPRSPQTTLLTAGQSSNESDNFRRQTRRPPGRIAFPARKTRARPGRGDSGRRVALAPVHRDRGLDQARSARACFFPTGAGRAVRPAVSDLQIPHDGRRRGKTRRPDHHRRGPPHHP